MSQQGPEPAHHNGQLKSIVERIERLGEEIKELRSDQGDIFKEAGGAGFDVKALRSIINLRKQSPEDRAEREAILETYMHALGMLA
jgi:uncharacterized protein (UPF0335 family)